MKRWLDRPKVTPCKVRAMLRLKVAVIVLNLSPVFHLSLLGASHVLQFEIRTSTQTLRSAGLSANSFLILLSHQAASNVDMPFLLCDNQVSKIIRK